MKFSLKRVLLPAIGALALLQCTVARPLLPIGSDDIVERSEVYENSLLEREVIPLEIRNDLVETWFEEFERRGGRKASRGSAVPRKGTQIKKQPKANPFSAKSKGKAAPPSPKPQPGNKQKALPNKAKLTLGKDARKELDNLGLHGKARKNTVKWHKNQVKKHMKTNPVLKGKAKTGTIEHIAHKGGSNPKEKNHITASFRDKNKKDVLNKFNGGKNHHLYVNNKGLPRQAKGAMNKNNAEIKGQSKSHQTSVGKTRTPGKSSGKGKGTQHAGKGFSKNSNKGFQRKGRK
ncbi:hypothetical protein NLJ89_g5077 [Agrocybe chaxingu]|uniref:Uncharacterized protein n=1 Tax=Agrocybe chaxingu TaxID=84603 RepID=A0A9W8MTY8_9AGAR|nr:hypothetical protein NLJ89_g5077 [Agrocybe chaxingu]